MSPPELVAAVVTATMGAREVGMAVGYEVGIAVDGSIVGREVGLAVVGFTDGMTEGGFGRVVGRGEGLAVVGIEVESKHASILKLMC